MLIAKRNIYWQDIVIIAGFILYLGAGFCTQFVLTDIGRMTDQAEHLEANPGVRIMLDMGFTIIQMQWFEIAFLGGFYFIIRHITMSGVARRPTNYLAFSFFSVFVFVFFLQNFLNDFPIVLAMLVGAA